MTSPVLGAGPQVPRPPPGAVGVASGAAGKYGSRSAMDSKELQNRQMKSLQRLGRGDAAGSGAPQAMHNKALQQLAALSPLSLGSEDSPLQMLKDRQARLRKRGDMKYQEEIYSAAVSFLMEPERWTFGCFAAYQRKVLDLMGANSWRRRLAEDNPNFLHLEKELRVLEAMTPAELQSNHKRVFTEEAKRLIAEKADCSVRFCEQVIMEHDMLRADRRWFQIRQQFDKPLPTSFEEREHMAEYDRPMSETEQEKQDEYMEKYKVKMERKKPPRTFSVVFRRRSIGGDRWSTRPPRWYPVNWKMRDERKTRMEGAGMEGGGDRGRPWGRLGAHLVGGGFSPPRR